MKLFSRSYICLNLFCIVILFIVTESSAALNELEDLPTVYELVNDKFNELLSIIATVNEEKNNALKRIAELESYNVGNGILRFVDKEEDPLIVLLLLYNKYPTIVDALFKKYEVKKTSKVPGSIALRNIPRLIKDYYDYNLEISSETENLFDWRKDIKKAYKDKIEKTFEKIEAAIKGGKGKKDLKDKFEVAPATKVETANVLRASCWKTSKKLCRRACKDAWKSVCSEYYCRSSMKKRFKKKCKSECRLQFDD